MICQLQNDTIRPRGQYKNAACLIEVIQGAAWQKVSQFSSILERSRAHSSKRLGSKCRAES